MTEKFRREQEGRMTKKFEEIEKKKEEQK